MNKRKKILKEEERVQKSYLISYLADMIRIHYKYLKNKDFDTFNQYLNSCNGIISIKSIEERIMIYREVDDVIMRKYKLFFAHYELEEPIYLVSVVGKE